MRPYHIVPKDARLEERGHENGKEQCRPGIGEERFVCVLVSDGGTEQHDHDQVYHRRYRQEREDAASCHAKVGERLRHRIIAEYRTEIEKEPENSTAEQSAHCPARQLAELVRRYRHAKDRADHDTNQHYRQQLCLAGSETMTVFLVFRREPDLFVPYGVCRAQQRDQNGERVQRRELHPEKAADDKEGLQVVCALGDEEAEYHAWVGARCHELVRDR